MNETHTFYAVLLHGNKSHAFYARTEYGSTALFVKHKDAVAYRNQLHESGCSKGKVKKVEVEIRGL